MLRAKVGKYEEQHLNIDCVKFQRNMMNRIWITIVLGILAPKRLQRCRACARDFQNSITLGLFVQRPNPPRDFVIWLFSTNRLKISFFQKHWFFKVLSAGNQSRNRTKDEDYLHIGGQAGRNGSRNGSPVRDRRTWNCPLRWRTTATDANSCAVLQRTRRCLQQKSSD